MALYPIKLNAYKMWPNNNLYNIVVLYFLHIYSVKSFCQPLLWNFFHEIYGLVDYEFVIISLWFCQAFFDSAVNLNDLPTLIHPALVAGYDT